MDGNCEKCRYYIARTDLCTQDWMKHNAQCLYKDLERIQWGIYQAFEMRDLVLVLKKRISQGQEEFIAALTTLKIIYPNAFEKENQ